MNPSVLAGRFVTKLSCSNSPVAVDVMERLYSLNFFIPALLCRKQGRQPFIDVSRCEELAIVMGEHYRLRHMESVNLMELL